MGGIISTVFDFFFGPPPPRTPAITYPSNNYNHNYDYYEPPPSSTPAITYPSHNYNHNNNYYKPPPPSPPAITYPSNNYDPSPPRKPEKSTTLSFRLINLHPTKIDLSQKIIIYPNQTNNSYRSINHYLEVQFRLLWCDFLRPLIMDISQFLEKPKSKFNSITVHENVLVTSLITDKFNEIDDKHIKYKKLRVEFFVTDNDQYDDKDDDDDEEEENNSKRFLPGSVLCFLQTGTKNLILAKITENYDHDPLNKEERLAKNKQILDVIIKGSDNLKLKYRYTMLEYKNYYEPYYQVLTCLQDMDESDFSPLMTKILIETDKGHRYPRYLTQTELDRILNFRNPKFNKSQLVAFKQALIRDFALIQGPPGTGKTFLALHLVKHLLEIKHLWSQYGPILMVGYKNNSLDNLLEGLLCFTKSITRVGGGCKNQNLEPYTLKNKCDKSSRPNRLSIMSESLILGMTTTCAARLNSTLQDLKCPIVIVEEAAEVFEAHLLTSLTRFCQHVILIGDHQQLRPIPADHELGTQYGLDISLFERMLLNKIPCFTLNEQHRMRPEISKLITPLIYPDLIDGDLVQNRPKIQGVTKNLFLITHNNFEDTSGTSKGNSYEASFLINFAKYLIRNNYKADQITILAAYSAQVDDLKIRVKRGEKFLKSLEVASVDSYQGKENDIILLSLVRSNTENKVGFLNTVNRVCVLLSRARNGFYIIGNMKLLSSNSQFWREIKKTLNKQKSLGPGLPLQCTIHKNRITYIKKTKDFDLVKNGGCSLKCEEILNCGRHRCSQQCHVTDRDHMVEFKCQICARKKSTKKN